MSRQQNIGHEIGIPFVQLYHRTSESAADSIESTGWRDNPEIDWPKGVFLSTYPLTICEGAKGPILFSVCVRLPVATLFYELEVVEQGKPYREFVVPADILNDPAQCHYRRLAGDDESAAEECDEYWNEYPPGEPEKTFAEWDADIGNYESA